VDYGRQVRREADLGQQLLWGLVGVNVAVFVAWTQARGSLLGKVMADHFLVSVESIAHYRVWTLITSEFSHVDAGHLLFNMLGLWSFGRAVVQALGWRGLAVLYFAGGAAASVLHVLFGLATGDHSPALGASGAVMAIAVAFARLFPEARISLYFVIDLPAPVAVGGFVLLDVLGVVSPGDGVAHAAHLGGAAFGLLYVESILRRR
jgi:membrane associated rhomboid family serine protease